MVPREIVLVRHGRPDLKNVSPIAGTELAAFVRRYNESGINRDQAPPDALRQMASASGCILSSDLPRSSESAAWLSDLAQIEPDLHEAGLPDRIRNPIRLHPAVCVAMARAMWWLNCADSHETILAARERASRVADRLIVLAKEQKSVMVVGHGMFNRLVAKCLRERGWTGPRFLPRGYWSTARFVENR